MHVREATPDDALVIAQVRVDTWRVAYDGLVPAGVLAALDAEQESTGHLARLRLGDERGSVELVAETDGRVVGWAAVGPSTADATTGELYAIYVLPDHWSAGVGHALLEAAEAALRERGFDRAALWVLDGNDRASTFYSAHGWLPDGTTKSDDLIGAGTGWVALERRRVKLFGGA